MRLCDFPFLHLHFTQFRSIGSRDDRPCNLNRWIFLHPIRHRSLVLRTIIALDSSTLLSSNACAVNVHSSNPRPRVRTPCACRCYGEGYVQRMGKTRKMGGRTFRINMRRSWNVGRGAAREEEFPVANERWDASAAALFASQV